MYALSRNFFSLFLKMLFYGYAESQLLFFFVLHHVEVKQIILQSY